MHSKKMEARLVDADWCRRLRMDRNLIYDAAYLLHAADTLKTENSSGDILSSRDSVVFVVQLLTEALYDDLMKAPNDVLTT